MGCFFLQPAIFLSVRANEHPQVSHNRHMIRGRDELVNIFCVCTEKAGSGI